MTIYDIAKLSGVSKSTVSRVLNGESRVSPEAKAKVEAVVREHNYVPNRSAAMTRKNREVILVLVTRLDSYSETRLIRGMMESASSNIEFLITETQFNFEKTKRIVENNKNVNGIIVFAISGENYEFLDQVLVPVVIIGQKVDTKQSNVYFDDYNSMKELVVSQNQGYPIFLGYNENDMTMVRRYNAACDALDTKLDYVNMERYGHLKTIEKNRLASFQTFICATETIALETYKYILKNNISDYKILSAGNNRNINFVIDNFTTIDFHYKQAGKDIITNLAIGKIFELVTEHSLVTT